MPKRKRPEEKPEEQFKRFLETAKDREVDEKDAEQEFEKISRRGPKPQDSQAKR